MKKERGKEKEEGGNEKEGEEMQRAKNVRKC